MHKTMKSEKERIKNNSNRGMNGFNTATKSMKSPKDYERMTPADIKAKCERMESYEYEL